MTPKARSAAWLVSVMLLLGFPPAMAADTPEELRARELEADIARRTQAYRQQQATRRTHIAGTVTEARFEQYLAGFRRKIDCSASKHYPGSARGKTYGEMIVTVSILADGSLEKARVDQSSGHKVLDESVITIAKQAAPFAPFPPEIRRDTDVLEITRTWTFTQVANVAGDDPCQ
ncbi:MAG: energy transducer TonB, partial [Azoarcus sp.]|nr:energy transducer TonB [Azoarcus sp.]